jgi:hypothetical protein
MYQPLSLIDSYTFLIPYCSLLNFSDDIIPMAGYIPPLAGKLKNFPAEGRKNTYDEI